MPCPQCIDVEETVPADRSTQIADVVAVMMVAVMTPLGLACLISGASRRYFGLHDVPIPDRFITDYPNLAIGIPCAVLAVALCIKKLMRAASRTGVNDDYENRGTAEDLDGSVEAGERGIVQPGIRTPPVVTIPSSSSSRSGGGVSAGHGVVTPGDVELAGGDRAITGGVR